MKIGIITNEYPPHVYGGAGVHVEYLTNELIKADGAKHSVKVCCFGLQNEESPNLTVKGVDPKYDFSAKDPRHNKFLDTILKDIVISGELNDVDILHCHTWYAHFAGLLLKQLLGVPLVLTTHSLEPHRPWKAEQLGTAYKASSWIERNAYENADGVIAISKSMRKDVHDLYKVPFRKIGLIHNGINLNEFKAVINKQTLEKYGIDKETPYVLFVGRITRQKGIIHLVKALKYLKPGFQVVLCAGSPDTEAISKEMIEMVEKARTTSKNKIVWISEMVPKNDLIAIYSQASVFVCPSVYEPFGIINLEAMACNIPVVATKTGGICEVVVHGQTGLLVPLKPKSKKDAEPSNPDKFSRDLAKALNSILGSKEKIAQMGLKARKRVEDNFSWQSIAEKTIEFYKQVIKRS